MRFFVLFLAALLLPRVLAAQNVRGTTLVGNPAGDAVGPALDSDADLTALVYGDVQAGSLWIHTSDGRGVTWSAAGRVDDGTSAAYKYVYPDAVRVAGNRVYVYWTEARSGPSPARDVWFNWSGDGGVTFQPADLPVDKGLPTGGNDVKEVRMEVDPRDPTNPGDDVIVLLMRVEDDLAASDEHLYINWSVNSGLTFQAVAVAVSIHPMLGPVLVTEMDLALEGGVAYPAWIDNFLAYMGPDDCWMSALDTVTGTFLRQDVMVNAPYAGLFDVDDDVAVDVNNGILAVLWLRTPLPGPFVNELRSNVSPDGGVTWIGETGVGSYLPAVDDVNEPDVAVAGNGNILAAWHDNRFPPSYATWTAVSVNGGASWLQDLQLSVGACHPLWLRCPGLEAAAVWMAPDLTAPPHFVEAAMSLDAGLTWTPAFPVSGNSGDADRAVLAWNSLYTNFPIAWLADDLNPITQFNDVYAGGFRPQTLTPVGNFTVAGSPVSFQVSNWPQADRGKAFGVVVSNSLGNYTISDGRNTGLVRDALFNQALQNIPGLLSGTIDPFGNGSTPTFAVPALAGTIYAVAGAYVSLSNVGAITDTVSIP